MQTDAQLQREVLAELAWVASVHASQIGVEVSEGVVTLAGEVSSYAEKIDAESAALHVAGVRALAVELEVKLSELGRRTDADIARSLETALSWIASLPEDAIHVMVESGWVTLSGTVGCQYQRQAAIDAVRYLVGVRGVSNEIAIQATVISSAIRADIEAALQRRALRDTNEIAVDAQDGNVTLTGTVHSQSERELAIHAVWATPGVRTVIDKLALVCQSRASAQPHAKELQ